MSRNEIVNKIKELRKSKEPMTKLIRETVVKRKEILREISKLKDDLKRFPKEKKEKKEQVEQKEEKA
jgi:hypothetical protein